MISLKKKKKKIGKDRSFFLRKFNQINCPHDAFGPHQFFKHTSIILHECFCRKIKMLKVPGCGIFFLLSIPYAMNKLF